jgi:hypothetical protein
MVGFVSGLVKTDPHCALSFCLFDSPTQQVYLRGTVIDFINLKKFLLRNYTTSVCEPLTTERVLFFLDRSSSQHKPAHRNSTVNKTI